MQVKIIESKDEFKGFVDEFYAKFYKGKEKPLCFGIARCDTSRVERNALEIDEVAMRKRLQKLQNLDSKNTESNGGNHANHADSNKQDSKNIESNHADSNNAKNTESNGANHANNADSKHTESNHNIDSNKSQNTESNAGSHANYNKQDSKNTESNGASHANSKDSNAKDSKHIESKNTESNHRTDSKDSKDSKDSNKQDPKKSPFSFFYNLFKKKDSKDSKQSQEKNKNAEDDVIYKDNRKVIALNFPLLNFKENYGSFAVFATAAGLDSIELSQNEIIIDVNANFVVNCLCLYAPFIIEELENSPEMQAYATSDSPYFKGFNERAQKLLTFLTKFLNNEFDGFRLSDAFRQEAVLSLILSISDFGLTLGKTHKNIQVIFEILKVLYLDSSSKYGGNEFVKFQFIAFNADEKAKSLQVAYAKLHALSKGYAPLRSLNLDSIFGLFPNLAWSGNTPYELEYLRENEINMRVNGRFPVIDYIDKFPRYLMQVLPQADNIRILDSSKTRFGAFLGAGYTQMPGASYVNFNAGSLGACMNEGRISSSVVIGEGSDVGGGASILGVLSGGNTTPISIGKNCLLGANSVTGISLGDSCIVDAGIAILAGSKVCIAASEAAKLQEVNSDFKIESSGIYKGSTLSGMNGLHFRVNTLEGKLIAFRSNREIKLNADLH